jgi:uncharacterized Tic20 family protein
VPEDEDLEGPVVSVYTPSALERVEAAIVHLTPWANIIFIGYFGLVLAVLAWSFRRHAAPWTSHASKQVIVWQLLSIPFFLIAIVFIQNWVGPEDSLYRVPAILHPVVGDAVSLWQLILVPFAVISTFGSIRSLQGVLFRYPLIGDLVKPPTEADRRPLW